MPLITVLDFASLDNLVALPMDIGKLVTLQYLNLSDTGIRRIPREPRNLKN